VLCGQIHMLFALRAIRATRAARVILLCHKLYAQATA